MQKDIEKQTEQAPSILRQISELAALGIKELKVRYTALFSESNPPTNKVFLIRRIAFKLQEDAFGKLPEEAQNKLETLKTDLNPIKNLGARPKPAASGNTAKPAKKLLMPGTFITKSYKGTDISVKVLSSGFEYNGSIYKSLSRIAKEVTGVHQSGFVFFGV